MIYSLSESFINSYALKRLFDAEKEWHQGTDTIAPALGQIALIGILFAQVTCCSKHWKWSPLPSISPKLLFVIRLSPLILGLGTEAISRKKHPNIHFIGKTLSYSIGKCVKIAYGIVTLSMIISYPPLFVSSTAGYLVAIYIADASKIPYDIRKTTQKVINILSSVNFVIHSPTWIDRVLDSIILALRLLSEFQCQCVSDLIFGRFSTEVKDDAHGVSLKTIGEVKTAVNPHHLKCSHFQFTLDQIDPKKLKQIIDVFRYQVGSIDFEQYREEIERNLVTDEHFKSAEWTTDKKVGREIDFMKEGARILLYRLEKVYASLVPYPGELTSPIGSIEIRKPIVNDLKVGAKEHLAYLLHWLQETYLRTQCMGIQECQHERALFLINIGIHGANYCSIRLQELPKLMDGFARREDRALKPALFSLLWEKQSNLIASYAKFYHRATKVFSRSVNGVLSKIEGEETPHDFNRLLYLFGVPIGLNVDAALADRTLDKEAVTLERYIRLSLIRRVNQWFYMEHYVEREIIRWVRTAINNNRINSFKFIEWMEEQDGYCVDLLLGKNGQITDDAIRYFLLVHGVLGIMKTNCGKRESHPHLERCILSPPNELSPLLLHEHALHI